MKFSPLDAVATMGDDPNVIAALQAGGAGALDRFYRHNAGRVLAWAIRLGGPYVDPEDIAQEVFAIALQRVDSFRGDSNMTTWLFGITRNVVANHRRKARFKRLVGLNEIPEPKTEHGGTEREVERMRLRRTVQVALEQLPQKQREALVLVDLEERTAVEAGEMLGLPVGTIYSRLHHARRAFAKTLTSQGVSMDRRKGRGIVRLVEPKS